MDISVITEVTGDANVGRMMADHKALDGTEVEAGLFGGFAAKKAMWNEYGTSRGIPARPFLRTALYENEARFASYVAPYVAGIMNGASLVTVPSALGPFMVQSIRRSIAAGNFAPLAPVTVAKKGHAKPLLDTGDMYGSIDWRQK